MYKDWGYFLQQDYLAKGVVKGVFLVVIYIAKKGTNVVCRFEKSIFIPLAQLFAVCNLKSQKA